ncbi:HAMP domain-containing histidine kinase [Bacillus infantis]|uniref:sensor histidine kinase n=1 Tax=Bacillus infantis TaxID=324767 RepID=UPI001CD5E999|nr:HAMP domain-containing sensor histidine kinase [Bacillus infantis]MCA1039984.1 HAMP domain-containing histidine kinase [Bacillus infantis]
MKYFSGSLGRKIWLAIMAAIVITIVYSYFLSYLFYENLYVSHIEEELLQEGGRLASQYSSGPITEQYKEKVEWYNQVSDAEVIAVSNPRELSACLPFEIDYDTLIGPEERERLLKGDHILKIGYEERFGRKIMGVIIPLLDENRLEGILYLYIPVENISEVTKDFASWWIAAALLFLGAAFIFGSKVIRKLTHPLADIKNAAERVSAGDYSSRVQIRSEDEIGRLARAFNQMSSSIQKEDERKKDFLADISHELRTPISYIKGYSDAILQGIAEKDDKYLHLINREAARMERLVGDLLDLSRLDTDEYQLVRMPLPLAQVIEDSLVRYAPALKEKRVELRTKLDPAVIIMGDEGRIEQIVQNIMDNSIRYTDKGYIEVILKASNRGCVLTIIDTGVGIPAEDLKSIKQRFYRVNKARSRDDGGTGLGLAIAERLIQLHNGTLSIASSLGEGTTVTVKLPVLQD